MKRTFFLTLNKHFRKYFNSPKNKNELLEHKFFKRSMKIISLKIDKIKIENKAKQKISKKFLRIFFMSLHNELKSQIKNLSIEETNLQILEEKFINNIDKTYDVIYELAKSEQIPVLFIDKFNTYHSKSKNIVKKSCRKIIKINIIKEENVFTIVDKILDMYLALITFTMFDLEQVLTGLNGELDQEFKRLDLR